MADQDKASAEQDFDPLIPVGSFDMSPREEEGFKPRVHAIPALSSLSKLGNASSSSAAGMISEDTPRTQYERALLNEPLKTSRLPFPWENDFTEEKYLLQIKSARNTQIDESVWDMALDRSALETRGGGRLSGTGGSTGGGSDTEDGSNDDNPSPGGRRLNVREHSRNQREKRKALINSLENEAKTLSEEISRDETYLEEKISRYSAGRTAAVSHVISFLRLWVQGNAEDSEAWTSIMDQPETMVFSLPLCYTRFAASLTIMPTPGGDANSSVPMSVDGATAANAPMQHAQVGDRRTLVGLERILAEVGSLGEMCRSIAILGPSPVTYFFLDMEVPLDSIIVNETAAVGSFTIVSRNALLCGGKEEISVRGMFRCGLCPQSLRLQTMHVYYSEADLLTQLLHSFGPLVYRPHYSIPGTAGAAATGAPDSILPITPQSYMRLVDPKYNLEYKDEYHLVTTLDSNIRVLSMNEAATARFGSIVRRTLISADWVDFVVKQLRSWMPQTRQLDIPRGPSDQAEGGSGQNQQRKIFAQLYPFVDPDSPITLSHGQPVPNRILWVMIECTTTDALTQLHDIITSKLRRCLDRIRFRWSHAKGNGNVTNGGIQMDSISHADPPPPATLSKVMKHLENLLLQQSQQVKEESESSDGGAANEGNPSIRIMTSFVNMVNWADKYRWEAESASVTIAMASNDIAGRKRSAGVAGMDARQSPLGMAQQIQPLPLGGVGNNPLQAPTEEEVERQILHEFSFSLDEFFYQLRESGVTPQLIHQLQQVTDKQEAQVLEEFICICWSKHVHPKIRLNLYVSQQLIREQKYELAYTSLTEIIRLDPSFYEAYNRRATVLFSLHRTHECFMDLETVLKHNPMHYGALCGKGLLLMNYKSYELASRTFETVLALNPILKNDTGIQKNLQICRQAAWANSHFGQGPSSA